MKENRKNNSWIIILIAFILLLLISLLTRYQGSSDIGDYSDTAKFFAGKYPAKLRTSHPVSYGLMLSPLVNLTGSFLPLKLSSVFWISLLIISVYYVSGKKKKTLLLFITTPAIWYMAPWISPIPLAAFLVLWSYHFIKKYDEKRELKNLLYSGLLIGLAWVFWEAVIYFSLALIICFLYNKKLSHFFYFILMLFIGVIPKLIIDQLVFGFPFYSILKHFFAVIAFSFYGGVYGQVENRSIINFLLTLTIIPICTLILFTRENFKKYKRQIFFIIVSLFMAWIAGSQIRYVFITIPIIILLLGEILNDKQFKIQITIFLILTLLVINPYIIQIKYETNGFEYSPFILNLPNLKLKPEFTEDILLEDINKLAEDFPNQKFVVGNSPDAYQALFASIYWGDKVGEFISIQDYELYLKNQTTIFEKTICSNSKVESRRDICISGSLEKAFNDETDYDSIKYAVSLDKNINLDNFKLIKKYNLVSVFEKR